MRCEIFNPRDGKPVRTVRFAWRARRLTRGHGLDFARPGMGWVTEMTSASEHECTYSTVYGGEQWCDEHDSAYPCPGSATDQNDDQSDGE